MIPLYRRAFVPGLAGLFLTVLSGSVAGQGSLVEGRMAVDLPMPSGPVRVTMDYWVLPDSLTQEMGATLLFTGAARIDSVLASLDGNVAPFQLEEIRPGYWTGPVPLRMGGAVGSPGDTAHVRISYVVMGAWEGGGRVVVPVVASGWVPSHPHPRTFVGTVDVPPGLTVMESFPTSVVTRPKGAEGGVYQVSLQGVPAMLSLRVVEGDAPVLTLERLLDVFVVLFLLVMGAAGVRFLKRQER